MAEVASLVSFSFGEEDYDKYVMVFKTVSSSSHLAHCGPNVVLIIEVSLYRTAYCGPNVVLSIEVSLYRTAYCGPNVVLTIEVSLYRTAYCGPNGVQHCSELFHISKGRIKTI